MNRRTSLTSLSLLLAALTLQAQETTGTIHGSVNSAKGAPVAGALVRATSPSLLGIRSVITDASGSFRIPLLPPGNYEVTVTRDGYIAAKATMRVGATAVVNQPFVLKPIQDAGATVEVVAASAAVDKTETSTKTSFSQESLTEISGATGSIGYSAVILSPGVVGNIQYASVRGGSQQSTQYVVDGMSSRDNVTAQARLGDYTLDDLVEDAAVIQSPLNARYGNTSSGMVSIVTKRGGNDWTGTIRAKLSKQSWSAIRHAPRNRAGGFNGLSESFGTDDLQRTYEISVTGPLIKDHLSFTYGTRLIPSFTDSTQAQNLTADGLTSVWFNGALYPVEKYQEGQVQYGPNKTRYNQFSLFYRVNEDHSLEWTYTGDTETNSDLQYNLVTPDIKGTSNFQQSDKSFYSVAYHGTFGSNQTLDARWGKNRSDTQFLSGPRSPITLRAADDTTTSYQSLYDIGAEYIVGGGTADKKPDQRATQSATLNWSIILNARGSHQVDAGYELQKPIWGTVSRDNSFPQQFRTIGQLSTNSADYVAPYAAYNPATAGQYVVIPAGYFAPGVYATNLTTRATYFVGAESADITNPTNSFYVNDLWTIDKHYSVMAGLRYDKMELKDAKGTRFSSSWVSPRFEFKWDLNGDNRRLVNFSYGQFRGILNARHYRTFTEGRLNTRITRYWNATATPALVDYAGLTNLANYGVAGGFASSAMYDIDPGFKPEVNHEFTLGYRRSFDNGASWRATMVYRNWKDLFTSVGDPTLLTVTNPVDPSETFLTYKRTLQNDPEAKRQYKGFELEWNVPFGSELTFAGSYVYSRLTGNSTYGDATSFGAFSGLAASGYFRPQWQAMGLSSDQFEPNGQLALGRNHVMKTWMTYRVLKGKTVSSISLQGAYYAGDRQSVTNTFQFPTTTVPGTTDPTRPQTIALYYDGRGNFSGPDYWTANLQYNVEAILMGKLRIFSQLTVGNVFNHQVASSLYRDAYSTASPFSAYSRGYWSSSTATGSRRYGTPGTGNGGYYGLTGARYVTFDFGLKF